MQRYAIVAPPDTLFFGADGAERKDLRLTGEEDADKFLRRVAAAHANRPANLPEARPKARVSPA